MLLRYFWKSIVVGNIVTIVISLLVRGRTLLPYDYYDSSVGRLRSKSDIGRRVLEITVSV